MNSPPSRVSRTVAAVSRNSRDTSHGIAYSIGLSRVSRTVASLSRNSGDTPPLSRLSPNVSHCRATPARPCVPRPYRGDKGRTQTHPPLPPQPETPPGATMQDQLTGDIDTLTKPGGLLDQLTALITEQASNPDTKHITKRLTGSSPPWHAEAAHVLTEIHQGARDLENDIRYSITGRTMTRGGSDANTRKALHAITQLTPAVPEHITRHAAGQIAGWVRAAQRIRDIDQTERWVPLPRMPGMRPPPCPYCRTYGLRMNRMAGEVRCVNRECVDDEGRRPVARMEHGRLTGDAYLAFADGREVIYQ